MILIGQFFAVGSPGKKWGAPSLIVDFRTVE